MDKKGEERGGIRRGRNGEGEMEGGGGGVFQQGCHKM